MIRVGLLERAACTAISAIVGATLLVTGCSESAADKAADASAQAAEQQQENSDAIKAICEGSIKKQLKDPGSAQFSNEQVNASPTATPPATLNVSAGDHYYIVIGMVNAKNSFGGYTGNEAYGCDAVLRKNGDTEGIAHIVNEDSGDTSGG